MRKPKSVLTTSCQPTHSKPPANVPSYFIQIFGRSRTNFATSSASCSTDIPLMTVSATCLKLNGFVLDPDQASEAARGAMDGERAQKPHGINIFQIPVCVCCTNTTWPNKDALSGYHAPTGMPAARVSTRKPDRMIRVPMVDGGNIIFACPPS